LAAYLNPIAVAEASQSGGEGLRASRRVKDRKDLQMLLPLPAIDDPDLVETE
jgi:hypothetical protein